ncbi:hypothetical protein HYC85_031763 [Camellia sinensis]|uniref:Telomere repeat-binding protein 1-6-like ubiquitin-like domain-containing protein n=1 Tax=Camellia sinensis TaxID=4442 RepID=A0A7J7FRD7_CAMSI|nr:hypothetical protein HYC85_031763 [Camellia sinensis]
MDLMAIRCLPYLEVPDRLGGGEQLVRKLMTCQMCAFDLLATVAGKLLLEGESSPSSSNSLTGTIVKGSIKKERQDEDNPSKVEPCGRGSCDRSSFVSELVSQTPVLYHSSKEFSHVHNDDCSGVASVITSDCSEKVGSAEKLVSGKGKIQLGSFASKVEVASSGYQESCDCTLEDENKNKKQIKIEPPKTGNASNNTKADMCSSDDPAVRNRKPPTPVSLDNSVKLPLCTDYIPSGSFPACRDDVKLVIRDDDENSSGCTQPSTATKAFRPPPRIVETIILSPDSETRSVYHNRKIGYKRKRSLTDYPIKKRIFYDRSSVSNSDGGISSEGISSSPRKGLSCDASGSGATIHGASGTSACVAGQHTPFQSRDSHVKVRITSFKVPELFIEMPETATVGSLKISYGSCDCYTWGWTSSRCASSGEED